MNYVEVNVLQRVVLLCIGAIFFLSGSMKIWSSESFQDALLTWSLIPALGRDVLGYAVPIVELGCSTCILFNVFRTGACFVLLFFIMTVTIFYGVQSLVAVPRCGCFGTFVRAEAGWMELVVRNAFIALLLSACLVRNRGAGPDRSPTRLMRGGSKKGVTILEVLVSVVLIALLLSVTLPTIRPIREAARNQVTLSNLRQHAAVISIYGQANREFLPWFSDSKTWLLDLRYHSRDYSYPHFMIAGVWGVGLVDYYDGVWPSESMRHPGSRDDHSYFLTSSSQASAEYWTWNGRSGPQQWRAQPLHAVSFASSKAVFVLGADFRLPWHFRSSEGATFAMFDGSARTFAEESLVLPMQGGDGEWFGAYLPTGVFGLHTVEGLNGRDVR